MTSVARKQRRTSREQVAWAAALLDWYDRERRDLPWREPPDRRADPYRVWLSEVMLQQTTVKAATPYYQSFVARWPTLDALAAASLEEVLAAWAGLGYYSRARNLHACARVVCNQHGGRLPETEAALRTLPGIGAYTAAAVAAIAFDARTTPIDANVERVIARLFALNQPVPKVKAEIMRLAQTLTPAARTGDLAQALMDLGATVCTPKRPACLLCPLEHGCRARAAGLETTIPVATVKPKRPTRRGLAFLALREDNCVLLRRRPAHGLLGGMLEVPSSDLADALPPMSAVRHAPVRARWTRVPGMVVHTFTHFHLEMQVRRAVVAAEAALARSADPERCTWVPRSELHAQALPSVMRKIIAHGLRAIADQRS